MDPNDWLEEFNRTLCEGNPEDLYDMYHESSRILHYMSNDIHAKDGTFMAFCSWFIDTDPCLDFQMKEFYEIAEDTYLITGKYILRNIHGDDFCKFSMVVACDRVGEGCKVISEHVSLDETYMN